jgi:hypothetical protein
MIKLTEDRKSRRKWVHPSEERWIHKLIEHPAETTRPHEGQRGRAQMRGDGPEADG